MKKRIINYWNSEAKGYNRGIEPLLHSQKNNQGWKSLFSELLGTEPLKILDVGTGPGSISILLAEMGHDVTGVDLSEQMLTLAQKNADACGVMIKLKKGDAEKLPFENNIFDVVINRWVLWTVLDPASAVAEWTRVLKTGGKLIIVDGNWYNRKRSLVHKAWKQGMMIYTSINERRNAWRTDYNKDIIKSLWSTHADRPAEDIQFFKRAGLSDVQAIFDVNWRVFTYGEYLRQWHWGPTFLVTGRKV
jgi:ubiquinone/menaquinone biosynthesis C-methylase UbiE